MWYWYVARPDELMIDLDGRTLLELAVKRLEKATEFKPRQVFVRPSQTTDHFHMVVRLNRELPILYRLTYELYFFSHVYRSVKNLLRALDGVEAPSLLISPENWKDTPRLGYNDKMEEKCLPFWRDPDAVCRCKSHKDPERIWQCSAHKKLRGVQRGRSDNPARTAS